MKTKLFFFISIIIMHFSPDAQVKIGNNATTINSASLLELETTNRGLVLPRVSITDVSTSAPLAAGLLTGTVIYNSNSITTGGSGVGMYLWNGTKWLAISTGSISSTGWLLTGNSGTSYSTNFLGTIDNVSLRLRTKNIERLIIDSLGSVGIGSSSFNAINKEKLLIDYGTTTSHTLAYLTGSVDDFFQINLQNKSSGASSSTDYIATADDGTDSTFYVDFGINSSTYAPGVENWGNQHDAYLYASSRNLLIGCQSINSDVIFLLAGGKIKTNTALRLKGENGNVIVGTGENTAAPIGNIVRGPNGNGINIAGGSLTLQGGFSSGTAAGANINVNGGTSASGIAGEVIINTAATERMRIDASGNVGIGITSPTYKLSVLASGNPLYLSGVQPTAAFTTDSILTIYNGVVKKAPYSSLPSGGSGGGWQLTGNSGTSPGTNFIGTIDNQSLVFKTNSQLSGKIDLPLNNLSLGYQSANSITNGMNNTFLGYQSGYSNTTGASNTGIGSIALNANIVGTNNSALGMGALANNSTGSNNTGIGSGALRNNTTAAANTAIGASALKQTTTGSDNTANGYFALTANTTGFRNTANGSNALVANTTGYENSANGGLVLYTNTTGSQNTAGGNTALYANTTGNANTANGFQSLYTNTTGYYNTAYGYKSLLTNTTGNSNTAIGYGADVTANNLSNATAIGYNAQVSANNSLVLGGTGINAVNVGIGITSPSNKLQVVGANPLSLLGLVATSTLANDSVLTVNAGVVKAAPFSSFSASGSSWLLTGNSSTNPSANFIGTIDNQSLVFKTNNQLSGKIDLPLNNLSLGYQSANNVTTGTNNTFIGYQSGFNNTTGSNNTSIGAGALKNTTNAIANTAIGSSSLRLNTTGSSNTSTGSYALQNNTTGSSNTATGYGALGGNAQGNGNTANGAGTLQGNVQGINNTAIGNGAMQLNDQGNYNTALGAFALQNSNLGASNTALGSLALAGNTSGTNNTSTGYQAGNGNTTGTGNTFLGYQADATLNNLTNATAIGYTAQVSANNSLVLGNGANVGIGVTNPSYKLHVVATANPLYLAGVQATATFSTDSVLTILNGIVKKAPYSSFTGNSAVAANTVLGNFTNASAIPVFNAASADGQFLVRRSGVLTFGTLQAADLPAGSNSYIQNQSVSSQSANFYINGPASIGTANVATSQLSIATSNAANTGLTVVNSAASGTDFGDAISGQTSQTNGFGVWGTNANTTLTGAGTGVVGAAQGLASQYLSSGAGGAFTGYSTGVYAYNSSLGASQAVYCYNGGVVCRVDYFNGVTQYKILGTGTVSTTASSLDNQSRVTLHAPEAPEIYFEDYGEGKLINGKIHINLDPLISKNVTINEKHPLRVFIQLEGDCNGVYVTNKTKTGFDVEELKQGTSGTSFQWHIVCNRANEELPNGKISHNEEMRFEQAPTDAESLKANSLIVLAESLKEKNNKKN